jgi:hypothetical protein
MPSLTFFPLGNADSCRIELAGNEQILFDYAALRDPNDKNEKRCDLPAELRKDLKKAKRDSFDVVAFTHLDDDHVHGALDFFYLEHAAKYQSKDRIKIDELWVPAAAIIEEGLKDDARAIRAEARHRLKNGERIRVFSRPEQLKDWLDDEGVDYEKRKHLITDAGQLVPRFTIKEHGVEFFVHSPFASRLDDGELLDRNTDALAMQATFVVGEETTRVILGSDLDHEALTDIVRITRAKKREERLEWDVFKLPHHCSYLSIGPEKGTDKTAPVKETKWLYEGQGQPKAIMVAPCWPIPAKNSEADKASDPPHRQAYNYHKEHTDNRKGEFCVTMEHPSIATPDRLVIEIDATKASLAKRFTGGAAVLVSRPAPRAGAR